jgi:DNA-binding MarR family transcriptional regulator
VSRLASLGLVTREEHAVDRRVRKVAITPQGKSMTNRIDSARERIGRAIFDSGDPVETKSFIASMRKFADALEARSQGKKPMRPR